MFLSLTELHLETHHADLWILIFLYGDQISPISSDPAPKVISGQCATTQNYCCLTSKESYKV